MAEVMVGTADGLFGDGGGWQRGSRVQALAGDASGWWAVLDNRSLWRGAKGSWEQVAESHDPDLRCLLASSTGLLAGTDGAHLLRLAGSRMELVDGFETVTGRERWYTPWGGPPDIRSLAEGPDGYLYANVHVGGIVVSADGGTSWESSSLDIDCDIHQVVAEPLSGIVLAAAGDGGLARSDDGGQSWAMNTEGLHATYCRALAVVGRTLLLSASTGPRGEQSAVYRCPLDGAGPFERCRGSLPEWFSGNVDTAWLAAADAEAYLASPEGRLYFSADEGASWKAMLDGLPPVTCVGIR